MSQSPSLFKRVLRPFATNEVETGNSAWYPEFEPHVYDQPPQEVFDAVSAVVDRHRRWTPASANPEQLRLDVEVRTKLIGYVDDMTIWVMPVDGDQSEVSARSASRVGRSDFGQNARTIRDFFTRLDHQLG